MLSPDRMLCIRQLASVPRQRKTLRNGHANTRIATSVNSTSRTTTCLASSAHDSACPYAEIQQQRRRKWSVGRNLCVCVDRERNIPNVRLHKALHTTPRIVCRVVPLPHYARCCVLIVCFGKHKMASQITEIGVGRWHRNVPGNSFALLVGCVWCAHASEPSVWLINCMPSQGTQIVHDDDAANDDVDDVGDKTSRCGYN